MLLRVNGVVKTVRIDDIAQSLVFVRQRNGSETCNVSDSIETMTSNGWCRVQRIVRAPLRSGGDNAMLLRVKTTKGNVDVTQGYPLIKSRGGCIDSKDVRRRQTLLASKIILAIPENREKISPFRISLEEGGVATVRCSTDLARLMSAALFDLADNRLIFHTSASTHRGILEAARSIHPDVMWHENVHNIIGIGDHAARIRQFYQKEAPLFPMKLLNSQFKSHQIEFVNYMDMPMRVGDSCLALALRTLVKSASRRCTNCIVHEGFCIVDYGTREDVEVLDTTPLRVRSGLRGYMLRVPGKEQFDATGISMKALA